MGYKEPEQKRHEDEDMSLDPSELMPEPAGFVAFRGAGNRLDGKKRKDSTSNEASSSKTVYVKGIPDYDYQIGSLKFIRRTVKQKNSDTEENGEFRAFSGTGFSLRSRN